jgi:hypothetical protein
MYIFYYKLSDLIFNLFQKKKKFIISYHISNFLNFFLEKRNF